MPLKASHQKIIKEFHFERWNDVKSCLASDAYDDYRLIYLITNPDKTEIVYIGDTEQGRDVRGRLKAHMKDRDKVGFVENESDVYIHIMVTEFLVLDTFEEINGALPVLNKKKSQKHV